MLVIMVHFVCIYSETLRRLLDDPTAELMRYRLKLSFMSVVVLHEDPPATPGDRLDVGQTSAEKLKSLSEAYYGRVEGIVTSGMAVELSDLRRQFSQACRHDHIRWEPLFFFLNFFFLNLVFVLYNALICISGVTRYKKIDILLL